MATDCPYCSLAKKSGELFCSRHQADMASLQSGIFYINEKQFEECEPHVTRLSLNFNLDTSQSYFIGNKEYKVSPQRYLLINEGQSFSTFANAAQGSRMVTIAFKVGLAAALYQNLTRSEATLLTPFEEAPSSTLQLFEQTHCMDDYLSKQVPRLLQLSGNGFAGEELQDRLEEMLIHVLSGQLKITKDVEHIKKVKASTRLEIYRRLHVGFEFIQDNYNKPLTIDTIASHACLSSFNFKRLFKEFYRQSPHQFIISLRIARAKELLAAGLPVKDVCGKVGCEDVSSFIRLFKKVVHITPDQYRKN
jgi:AraC family transcriptional regulator